MNRFLKQYKDRAEDYMAAQTAFYKEHADQSRANFYAHIQQPVKGQRLLDAGCGFGKDLVHFQREGADVYGFDGSEGMIRIAREQHPELTNLSVQEFENLDYEDTFFDIIISRYALYYAADLEKAYQELHRVLKPGGTMTLLVAHPLLAFIAKKERRYHDSSIVEIPLFDNAISIIEPSRTLGEYLSPFVLKRFDLLALFEGPGLENAPTENSFAEVVPDYLILKFIKR